MGIWSSTSPPPQPRLAMVSPDLQGVSVVPVVTGMSRLGYCRSRRSRWSSSSGAGDTEPSAKKAHPRSFLPVSSRYGVVCRFTRFHFSFSFSDFKRWCWGNWSCTSSPPIVRWSVARLVTPPYLPLVASVQRGTPTSDVSKWFYEWLQRGTRAGR
jgi:hypothetical protein